MNPAQHTHHPRKARPACLPGRSFAPGALLPNSGSSTGLGVTFALGGTQSGLSFQVSASRNQGLANGRETVWDNTLISASESLSVKSGRDTILKGAQLTISQFLDQHSEWRSPLGGHQGGEGQMSLLGIQFNYDKGSLWDKLAEAYAGTHDTLNSLIWYDELGNSKNLKGVIERVGTTTNMTNVGLATPFALSVLLPPEVWNTIFILNKLK